MKTLLAILLVASQAGTSYAGKPLDEVLRDLQRRGLNVLFSSELVKPSMIVAADPKATTPRRILDEVIAPHGLAVRAGPRESFLIVRAPRAPGKPPAPAIGPVAQPATAQAVERTLSGFVIRSDSRAPIDGATVSSGGKTATTAKDGRFVLRLPAAPASVTVAATGFFPLTTTVDLAERDVLDAELTLAPPSVFESSVEVLAPAPSPSSSPSATAIAPATVLKTAGSVDNVFRTLHTMPGVAATQEISSRITVRGGSPDQNLTVMDGVEVHDPFRLFGLASAFNPETIQQFELATSGFSAKYGDRLSSLLLIENRDGDRSRRFGTSGSLSITDANLIFEGRLPGRARGSWLVTGRRTYYDQIAGRMVDAKFPQFADLQAKAVWEPAAGRKLTAFGLRSRQSANIDDNRPEDDERVRVEDDTRNDLLWMRFDTPVGARIRSTTVAGYSRTQANFGFNGRLDTGFTERSNAPFELDKPKVELVFSRQIEVNDVSGRQELAWSLGAHTLDVGGELHRLRTHFRWTQVGDSNPGPPIGTSNQTGVAYPEHLDSQLNSTRAGAWVIDTWRPGTRARIETGLRLDRSTINEHTTLSPRVAASFAVNRGLSARASFGRYAQSPGYEKSGQSDEILNFTAESAQDLRTQRAYIASLSFEQMLGSGAAVRVETYYKRLSDLLLGRLETEPERLARLAEYNFPASHASSLPVEPLVTTVPSNDGRGRGYGFDVLLSRMTAPVDAKMRGWISYTFGKADLDAYGRTYPFAYDRRHAISAVLAYRLSSKWEFSSTTRWATGFPRTAPVGVRLAGEEQTIAGRTVIEPKRDFGYPVYEANFGGISNLNNARLPNFARTDIRATWRPRGLSGRWELYVEVVNMLNKENGNAVAQELQYDRTSDRPTITERPAEGLTLVPTIGVRWRF
jgi:hypothetical protein